MARVGILGLPNVGKTTLFNALTGRDAATAPHPYSTTEPNIGVARVPDPALERASSLEGCAKTVFATLELLDLPAMAGPGHTGLAARFLGRLREEEALAVVLRAFEDAAIPSDESGTDPVAQAETLLLELTLADAEVFSRRADKASKEASADRTMRGAAEAFARAAELLEEGHPLRDLAWTDGEHAAFRDLAPLTLKPAVWVVNVGEEEHDAESLVAAVEAAVPGGDTVVALSTELEEEAARLDEEDRAEFFEGLGLGEGALTRVVHATYGALGVRSFYTLGANEAHAWTLRHGATAREAAGKIHSDMERGFIRAEIAPIAKVIETGGWEALKAAGGVRVEGKDYEIAEGDVMLVRFSV